MANSQSPTYGRPADLREQDYTAFEASALTGNGTTALLAAPGVNKSFSVHKVVIVVNVAHASGIVTIQGSSGNVLVAIPTTVVGHYAFEFGEFPWGYRLPGNDALQAVISGTPTTNVSIQGYATS